MRSDRVLDYQKEYMETLDILWNKNHGLKSFKYFLDIAYLWFQKEMRSRCMPKLVALGSGIPEEILWASGCVPYWILGGSRCAAAWSDDCMPRDADPVNRSIMGFLCEKGGLDYSDALFLIPVNCDSMRKMLRRFLAVTERQQQVLSDSARLLVQNSYYTCDLIEWTGKLEQLIKEIEETTFRQMLTVLFENAVKYAADHTTVMAVLRKEGKKAVFLTVNEWNHKVKTEDLEKLFDCFYRGDKSRNRDGRNSGYGLGLSIARTAAKRNKGELTVSEDREKRLVFRAEFALCKRE